MVEVKNKKGLGRGLMSLFGDQAEPISIEAKKLKKVDPNSSYLLLSISDLNRSRYQPRTYFNESKIEEVLESLKNFDVIYPSIGENMSFLRKIVKEKKLILNFITRDEDIFCWNFSNKGYFNFKSNIPKILAKFQLN